MKMKGLSQIKYLLVSALLLGLISCQAKKETATGEVGFPRSKILYLAGS
jgi:hypothetical protein